MSQYNSSLPRERNLPDMDTTLLKNLDLTLQGCWNAINVLEQGIQQIYLPTQTQTPTNSRFSQLTDSSQSVKVKAQELSSESIGLEGEIEKQELMIALLVMAIQVLQL
ncbi:hypothetical protein GEMRC1_009891 [Eukaryota sp. GEM-RC1]